MIVMRGFILKCLRLATEAKSVEDKAEKAADIERDLAKRHLDELSTQLTTSWTIYIKFYTVFLTVNVLGLGLVAEKMDEAHRLPIVFAFVLQNVISLGTAIQMSHYSARTSQHFTELSQQISPGNLITGLKRSPIAGKLGWWAGIANAISHGGLLIAWSRLLQKPVPNSAPATSVPITNEASNPLLLTLSNLPPFKAEVVAASHSSLSGVMAGFALAGFFLLLERKGERDVKLHSNAMLLLFSAFLMASLSSYLFSTLTGETPARAYFLFLIPSMTFALHIFTLFAGINVLFATYKLDKKIARAAKLISFGLIYLCVTILFMDLMTSYRHAGIRSGPITILAFLLSVMLALLLPAKIRSLRDWIAMNVSIFCYGVFIIGLMLALYAAVHFWKNGEFKSLHIQSSLFFCIAGVAGWASHIIGSLKTSTDDVIESG